MSFRSLYCVPVFKRQPALTIHERCFACRLLLVKYWEILWILFRELSLFSHSSRFFLLEEKCGNTRRREDLREKYVLFSAIFRSWDHRIRLMVFLKLSSFSSSSSSSSSFSSSSRGCEKGYDPSGGKESRLDSRGKKERSEHVYRHIFPFP